MILPSINWFFPYKEEVTGSNPVAPTRVFQESYVCNDDLITNLYGPPFFQDDEWWIFAATNFPENLGTDSLYEECGYPCSPVAAVRFATRVSIDVSEDG